MTALDDLQADAQAIADSLEETLTAVAELDKRTEDLAAQFAALGNQTSAATLAHTATEHLANLRDHLTGAHDDLTAYLAACEHTEGPG